jgi:hypothetical protein
MHGHKSVGRPDSFVDLGQDYLTLTGLSYDWQLD